MTRLRSLISGRAVFCVASLALVMIASQLQAATTASDARKPNIISILAADPVYGDPAGYGQKRIKTPTLDRRATGGLRFTVAYAGPAVCAPAGCVLMTGLHGGHARIRGLGPPYLPGLYLLD